MAAPDADLTPFPAARGYPWRASFYGLTDAAGGPVDLSAVTLARVQLRRGRYGTPGTAALTLSTAGPTANGSTLAHSTAIAVGTTTYEGYELTLTEAETAALPAGRYWGDLDLARGGAADDLPPVGLEILVTPTARNP